MYMSIVDRDTPSMKKSYGFEAKRFHAWDAAALCRNTVTGVVGNPSAGTVIQTRSIPGTGVLRKILPIPVPGQ